MIAWGLRFREYGFVSLLAKNLRRVGNPGFSGFRRLDQDGSAVRLFKVRGF
jgi:hypothetical protein